MPSNTELKNSIDKLILEVASVKDKQSEILQLVKKLEELQEQIKRKDEIIGALEIRTEALENRVADLEQLEQYSRMNDVIITGLAIKPRSYARAVESDGMRNEAGASNAASEEKEVSSTEQQVAAFMDSNGIVIDFNNIEACHTLPKKRVSADNATARPKETSVILRFVNRKHKTELLKQGKKLKGTDVYMNDHLTKRNADIAKKARELRREKKIQQTWTWNCKVFIKLNGSPEDAKVLVIRSIEELNKYT